MQTKNNNQHEGNEVIKIVCFETSESDEKVCDFFDTKCREFEFTWTKFGRNQYNVRVTYEPDENENRKNRVTFRKLLRRNGITNLK